MRLSDLAIASAKATPGLSRIALKLVSSRLTHHWVLQRLANDLDCRLEFPTTLSNGMKIHGVYSDVTSEEIRLQGVSEPETVSQLQSRMRPGMIFIDIGGNIGQYTLLAAGAGAQVHTFEADPQTFKVLERNVRSNGLAAKLNQVALSDTSGPVTFYRGKSTHIGAGSLRPQEDAQNAVTVQSTTLNDYAKEAKITRVDFVKVDVEGAELKVLNGGSNVFRSLPPMIIEFSEAQQQQFGSSNKMLAEYLRDLGYTLHQVTKDGTIPYVDGPDHPSFFNVLCMRESSKLRN